VFTHSFPARAARRSILLVLLVLILAACSTGGGASPSASAAVSSAAPASAAPASTVHPHGEGSHIALRDDAQPEGFPIKGNASSMLYHVPGSSHYERTNAEVWFADTEAAEAAGFSLPPSQQHDDETGDEPAGE